MSIEKRALSGTIAGAVSLVSNLTQNVILVPILLSKWGNQGYGTWLVLWAAVGILCSIDYGHQAFVGAELVRLYPVGIEPTRRVLASSMRVALVIALLQIAVAVAAAGYRPLARLLGDTSSMFGSREVGLALVLLTAMFCLTTSAGGIIVRLYGPVGKYARGVWWGVLVRSGQAIGAAAAAYLGGGILATVITVVVVVVAANVLQCLDYLKCFGELWPFWRGGSWRLGWQNMVRSLGLTAANVASQMQSNWLTIMVMGALGPAAAATFGTLRTLGNLFVQNISILHSPLAPEVIRMHVQGQPGKVTSVMRASQLVGCLFVNAGVVASLPLVEYVYRIWTRGKLPFDPTLYMMLSWSVAAYAAGAPLLNYVGALNKPSQQVIISFTRGAIAMALGVILVRRYGLRGVGLAVAVGELAGSFLVPFYFARCSLREMGGEFGLSKAFAALLGLGLLGTFMGCVHLKIAPMGVLLVPALVGFVVLALSEWRALPVDVRARLWAMSRLRRATDNAVQPING